MLGFGSFSLLFLFYLFPEFLMVKHGDFKTCNQSTFCTRHRSFADLVNENQVDVRSESGWKFDAITYDVKKGSITGKLSSADFKVESLIAQFTIQSDKKTVRFRVVEKDPLHPRYEFPFAFETEPEAWTGGFTKKLSSDGNVVVIDVAGAGHGKNSENLQLQITALPFSFNVLVGGEAAVSFNSKGYLYFEPYRNEQSPPPIAAIPPPKKDGEAEDSEAEKRINELKKNLGEGLGSDEFKGKTDSKPRGAASMGLDISFPGSTHVFGIPEHATSFSLKATRGEGAPYTEPYRLYNLDVFEYILDSPMALYGAVPFMLSHKKGQSAGVFWVNSAEMWVDVEKNLKNPQVSTHWMSESGIIDLFFFTGPTQAEIFNAYTKLTGRPQLPQKFAIAYHQCRWNYNTEQDALDVDANFDENSIPYDVLWLDIEHTDGKRYFTWDNVKFPNPEAMQTTLSDKGRKMITIVDPHIKKDSSYYVSKKASELDIFIKNKDGSVYDGWCWPGDSNWLDYSNPKAREYWAEQFLYKNYKGSTPSLYTWNDMNEPAIFTGPEATMPKDCIHFGEVEHRDIHNAYGMLQHRSTFEGHLLRSDNQDRPFILSRAFFAGTQRYGAIWTGDNTAEWGHLVASVPMLLSLGVAGITFAGADVGGFFLNPDAELLVRWYQVGSLQPFFRAHAHIETKRREPWLFGEPYTSLFRESVERRYRLLPYIYSLFQESSVSGSPIMRSMMQEFPNDEKTFSMDDQFMLGSAILVKPVTEKDQKTCTTYLPKESKWYDYTTFSPAKEVVDTSKLEVVPVYLRGGQIVPRKDRIRRSSPLTVNDPFTLLVALDSKGLAKGSIYLDDGASFDFQKGEFIQSIFTFNKGSLHAKSSSPSSQSVNSLPFNTRVERIVFIGLSKEPERILLLKGGNENEEVELVFVTRKSSSSGNGEYIVTVKNPAIKIGDSFTIEIK